MRSRLRLVVLAIATARPVASVAAAQDAATPTPRPPLASEFEKADTNHDGKLSPEEAKKAGFFTQQDFAKTDRDRDGTITLYELGIAVQSQFQDWVDKHAKADADGDGYVDKDEAAQDGATWSDVFERNDRDGDGRISREELMDRVTSTYYSETEIQPLYPNIIDKRF
jgi:Ca2+-binding EF-hand superfamily protein